MSDKMRPILFEKMLLWIIEELKRVGLDTAKSVLALNKEDLVRRTELEDSTVEDVLNILKQEFES